jgi:transcriptional regulator with XRE-family HTH domain
MTSGTKDSDLWTIDEVFGDVVRQLRKKRMLSQEQLGFESGLHRTYISLLERGKMSPTLKTLAKLALALNVSPSEVVRLVESRVGWPAQKPYE